MNRTGIRTRDLVRNLLSRVNPRAKSLVVTVFGDSILPLGGGIWLGELIKLMEFLGLRERNTRTAVYRLVQDGLLSAIQSGRRSYYSLTDNGMRQCEAASTRIYATRDGIWDGKWTKVWLAKEIEPARRDTLIQELGWQGFAGLNRNFIVRPGRDDGFASVAINALNLDDQTMVLAAECVEKKKAITAARNLVAELWNLKDLARDHEAFNEVFRPLARTLAEGGEISPVESFTVRTLLIHDYRRVVLRDPMLPCDLLPANWPGLEAAELAGIIYRAVDKAAKQCISTYHTDFVHIEGRRDQASIERFNCTRKTSPA